MKVYSKFLIFLFIFNILCSFSKAEESKFGINFGGYVKTDVFYDTRQTSNLREGHFLLYPLPVVKGVNGDDINAKATFNIVNALVTLGIANANNPTLVNNIPNVPIKPVRAEANTI